MAFDGVVIASVVNDLKRTLVGGRIMKVTQPEKDELILTIKNYDTYLLFMSADASLPLIYMTGTKKEAPLNSPAFCMLLRKHLTGARILDISQPDFERIVYIDIEHLDEMGDMRRKRLIVEIMGKHSNIIFCDDEGRIIDSIKRVPAFVSSVREVLPGREYFITKSADKSDPTLADRASFGAALRSFNGPVSSAIYCRYTGISPLIGNETVYRAGCDPDIQTTMVDEETVDRLYAAFNNLMSDVREGRFCPNIVYRDGSPTEFSSVKLSCLTDGGGEQREYPDISAVLENYYAARNSATRIRQKSADLRHVITTVIERESRKYDLQMRQLGDTDKREKFKLYGELLSTYGYQLEAGLKEAVLNNYYTGEDIRVPLDPDKTAIENAKSYYDKYSKLKRTYEALSTLTVETHDTLEHLESIRMALDIAVLEDDLNAIRDEMADYGYMKRHTDGRPKGKGKSGRQVSRPFHYVTEDGFHIYIGKNNYQNDELTFKFANGGDWWFHAKGIPGSHVVLKTEGREIPDRVFELAAGAAAYYSSARGGDKTEVDYLERKNVKKPAGSKPGFVVYYTNYSMVAIPGVDGLTEVRE